MVYVFPFFSPMAFSLHRNSQLFDFDMNRFFNLVFVVGLFFGLLGILIALFSAGFAITISGIAVMFAGMFYPAFSQFIYFASISPITVILAGICLTSLGMLFLIGSWYVGKGFYDVTIKYIKFNIKIIRGRSK